MSQRVLRPAGWQYWPDITKGESSIQGREPIPSSYSHLEVLCNSVGENK